MIRGRGRVNGRLRVEERGYERGRGLIESRKGLEERDTCVGGG